MRHFGKALVLSLPAALIGGAAIIGGLLSAAVPAHADMVGHGGLIRTIDLSQDGRLALTASFDYTARLWLFDEQRELLRFRELFLAAHEAFFDS